MSTTKKIFLRPADRNVSTGLSATSPRLAHTTHSGLSTSIPGRSTPIGIIVLISAFIISPAFLLNPTSKTKFPYQQAGLTERQAAAHLLSRLTFGAKPGDIDDVIKIGIDNWVEQQLKGNFNDEELNQKLSSYDAMKLSNAEILAQFPRANEVKKMAIRDGYLSNDSLTDTNKKELKEQYNAYRKLKGLRDEKELFRQFINQKIVRAAYSNNQLHEVLTDFWFNHFNVSITKNQCAQFIPVYERDAIRPFVTGKFQDMLLATAKSPAMLLYLDNFSSMGKNEEAEQLTDNPHFKKRMRKKLGPEQMEKLNKNRKSQGLNENYAREVMELHTLGVDGGYTQQDVTEAARVLTGWTIYPIKEERSYANTRKMLDKIGEDKLAQKGFVHEGDFLFASNRHDSKEKKVLGNTFAAGGGYQEGVALLSLLAHHPSTAKFICKKLAVRFVNDTPPQSLVDQMAKTFMEQKGEISKVILTMISSVDFWRTDALRAKTKSPLEYAISSVRALDADIHFPFQLNQWITRMGQKLYFYAAPTGFPDRGQYWINTGALLNRMNFGLALASKRIPGITFDLAALNNHHEPESAEAALSGYSQVMMPERNLEATIVRLTPLINQPEINKNIEQAANQRKSDVEMEQDILIIEEQPSKEKGIQKSVRQNSNSFGDSSMLAQVVGIIIGSPEFQRR